MKKTTEIFLPNRKRQKSDVFMNQSVCL